MSMIQKKRNNRRQSRRPAPTRGQINKAMEYYLAHGGKINKIESTERSLEEFLACGGNGNNEADEFLNGAT